MNLLTRYLFVTLLLAVTFSQVIICQEEADGEFSENEEESSKVEGKAAAAEKSPAQASDDQSNGQIVGQSLLGQGFGQILGQTLGQSLGQTPLNAFSFMFPAVNSLLSWGNLFPSQSLLGAPPPEEPQVAASKVVLVLAEDRDAAAGMSASNPEPTRAARQNAPDFVSQLFQNLGQGNPGQMLQPYSQLLQQSLPGDLSQLSQNPGQILSQALQQLPVGQLLQQGSGQGTQGSGQGLQQLLQNPGQLLSQALPQLNLAQIPGLGQIGQAAPTVGAALPEGEAPPQSPSGFQFPNIQSTIDSGSAMLGQALGQGSSGGNIPFPNFQSALDSGSAMLGQALGQSNSGSGIPFPNIQSAIDSGNTMLGQALGQGSSGGSIPFPNFQSALDSGSAILGQALGQSNSEGGIPFPNIQSAIDSGSAMLGQALGQGGADSGGLFGLKPLQPWPQPLPPVEENPIEGAASDISEVRVKPDADPSTHKVANSEKFAEMKSRAAVQEAQSKKNVPILWFHIPAQLSKQHYRNDAGRHSSTWKSPEELNIESKLYAFERQVISELKQLQELERQAKEMRALTTGSTAKTMKGSAYKLNYPLSKTPVHKITREDIEKALNDEYVRKLLQKAAQRHPEDNGKYKTQYMTDAAGFPMKRQTMVNDSTMQMGRQMSREDITKMMAYAYRMAAANGQEMPLMFDDAKKQENAGPREWIGDTKMDTVSWKPEQLPKQTQVDAPRQWVDSKAPQAQAPTSEQRQWAEQSKMKMQTMGGQQNIAEQRQRPDEKFKFQQTPEQRQRDDQQNVQQIPEQHRQWAEQKMRQQQFEQRQRQWAEKQMLDQKKILQHEKAEQQKSKQWTEQQPQPILGQQQPAEHQTMDPQQRKDQTGPPHLPGNLNSSRRMQRFQNVPTTMMQQQPMGPIFVGEATPQMPENAGKARHKDLFDEFDLFNDGHNGKGHHRHGSRPATIINYYYGQGGSRYPVYGGGGSQGAYGGTAYGNSGSYGSAGGYGGGYSGSGAYGAGEYGGGYGAAYGGSSAAAGSSYSTSYGGGGQGSNAYGSAGASGAYRTATGDAEIQEMLKQQQRQQQPIRKMTTEVNQDQPITQQRNTQKESQQLSDKTTTATFSNGDKRTASPSIIDSSNSKRLATKLKLNGVLGPSKYYANSLRHKRNANYGSLQPIDEKSLKDLRNTYKDTLREITLKPNEDPAEALMRYNAASIRDALERAGQEPLEITTGADEIDTHAHIQNSDHQCSEEHIEQGYNKNYDGTHLVSMRQQQSKGSSNQIPIQSDHRSSFTHHNGVPVPHNFQHLHRHVAHEDRRSLPFKGYNANQISAQYPHEVNEGIRENIEKSVPNFDTPVYNRTVSNKSQQNIRTDAVASHKTLNHINDADINAGLLEPDLTSVLKVIKQRLTNCCEKCKNSILSGIKDANVNKEVTGEYSATSSAVKRTHIQSPCPHCNQAVNVGNTSDDEHTNWLHDMSSKGYDRKFLTKAHQWEYQHSGELDLAIHNGEDFEGKESNSAVKLTQWNKEQSHKRDASRKIAPDIDNYMKQRENDKINKSVITTNNNGKAFASKSNGILYISSEQVKAVNTALVDSKEHLEATTMSPYAMRGKFMRSKTGKNVLRSVPSAAMKFDRTAELSKIPNKLQSNSIKSSENSKNFSKNDTDTKQAKVVELLHLLYDLSPSRGNAQITNAVPTHTFVVPITMNSARSGTTTTPDITSTALKHNYRAKRLRSKQRKPSFDNNNNANSSMKMSHSSNRKLERSVN